MNISDIHDCYGCGVCAKACGYKVIDIRLNKYGFFEPYITYPDKCTDCGICRKVCAFVHDDLSLQKEIEVSYGGWSNDPQVRQKCSSGGVGYELGKYLLSDGYKVCGVRYNVEKKRAEHYIASTPTELIQSIGSKYLQSYTLSGFYDIDKKQKYLITGTPCQIDSFRRYAQTFHCEDNFIFMDFFCHGVPSMLVWDKYLQWAEHKIGKITYASWRNKFQYGWHDSWLMGLIGEKKTNQSSHSESFYNLIKEIPVSFQSRRTQGDPFYALFLGNCCLGKQCYHNCKYKYHNSSADIRIGDMWGSIYKTNEQGVNAIISFTQKGEELLHKLNCTLVPHTLEEVAEGQMKKCTSIPAEAEKVWTNLLDPNKTIIQVAKSELRKRKIRKWKGRFNHFFRILNIQYQIR